MHSARESRNAGKIHKMRGGGRERERTKKETLNTSLTREQFLHPSNKVLPLLSYNYDYTLFFPFFPDGFVIFFLTSYVRPVSCNHEMKEGGGE